MIFHRFSWIFNEKSWISTGTSIRRERHCRSDLGKGVKDSEERKGCLEDVFSRLSLTCFNFLEAFEQSFEMLFNRSLRRKQLLSEFTSMNHKKRSAPTRENNKAQIVTRTQNLKK